MKFENTKEGIENIKSHLKREYNPDLNVEDCKDLDDKLIMNLSLTYNNFVNTDSGLSYKDINLHNVYNLSIKKIEDGEKLYFDGLDYSEIIENGLKTRQAYVKEMEKILAREASAEFINISAVRQCLRPFEEIFENLQLHEELIFKDWHLWEDKREKAKKYLNLLEDYEFVNVEDQKIRKGGAWQILYDDKFENQSEIETNKILSHFLAETYENLKSDKYNILQQAEPFFDIANTTYYTSLISKERVGQNTKGIQNIYERITGKTKKKLSKVNLYLMKLVKNNIIEKRNDLYYPNEKIYEKFFSIEDYKMSLKPYVN